MGKLKKINKVLHVVGGMDIGGTETMLMNLYREVYKDIQFDFISYYEKDAYYDNEIKQLCGKVIKIDSPSKVGHIKVLMNLYKIIKKGEYEVVHAHTLFNCGGVMLAAKLAGTKIRISHSHTNLDIPNNIIKRIYFSLMRMLIKIFSTNFIACSDSAGKYLFGESIINNSKYTILPNYVDYNKFLNCEDYKSIREKLCIKDKDLVVGHIGRFVDSKNHIFLIDIINNMVKKNDKVKAILVGDGPLKKDIEKKVKALGIDKNIYFLGLREDINKILSNCDLFIFPSIYEGLGLVILEAQGSGLPCLVSEAIQQEANLGLGLLKKINLEEGAQIWAEEALNLIEKKNNNKEIIKKAFEDNGYKLEDIIDTLLKVYKFNIR